MNENECVPCRGIQRLTPVSLFNQPGLPNIRYRVGQYNEFFQSMLASIGHFQPGADKLGTALERLRTRETDDPSIAWMDAWAVVADVLTFYQQRNANEAFLNTATRPESLHELSRLVGYEPRPGLSSSVLLSFEVDDQSEQVQIPAGTPAKSTPRPGTPDQPQTFETSKDFIARGDWNAIRPRLTRPQNLTKGALAELKRIYVKGTGLRVSPNDWLAIGNSEQLDAPVLKQVREVEERTSPSEEQITVLHLFVDPLSVGDLLTEVEDAFVTYFKSVSETGLFKNVVLTEFDRHKNVFHGIINGLRSVRFTEGMIHVDKQLQSELLVGQLLTHSGSTLRQYIESLVTEFESIVKQFSYSEAESEYKKTLNGYETEHQAALDDRLVKWKQAVDPLNAPSVAADQLQSKKVLYWKQPGTPTANTSDLLVGLDHAPATVADDGQVFQNVQVAQRPSAGITEYKVELVASNGITLNSLSASADNLTDLGTELAGFIRTSDAAGSFASYIAYEISDRHSALASTLLTAGVHVVKTANANQPYFENLQPNRTSIHRAQSLVAISVDFRSGAALAFSDDDVEMADPDLEVETEIIDGRGTLSAISSPVKVSALNTALDTLTYTTPDAVERRVIIRLKVSGPDSAGNDGLRAIAYRTLLIDNGPRYVRGKIAESLSEPNDYSALKTLLAATQATLTTISTAATVPLQKGDLKGKVDLNKSIVDPLLREDLRLDDINSGPTGLSTKIAAIKTELTRFTTHSHFQFIEQNASQQAVYDVAGEIPADPINASNGMQQFEDTYEECKTLLEEEQKKIRAIRVGTNSPPASLLTLANKIKGSLHSRRRDFVDRLDRAKEEHESKFTESDADQDVKTALENLFSDSSTNDTSLKFRLNKFNETLVGASTPDAIEDKFVIEKLYDLAIDTLDNQSSVSGLSPDAYEAIDLIRTRWEAAKASVLGFAPISDPTGGSAPAVETPQDILQRLLQNGGNLSVADAQVFLKVINEKQSHLWTQIVAALNPDRRAEILADFRDFRNLTLPRSDVWVFRGQANVFGWNSPGLLEARPATLPANMSEKQLVMVKDSPNLKPVDEVKDEIKLDGKLQDTLASTPVGIQREDNEYPQPYWIESVRFAPRTAYNLSGDSTDVRLRTGSEWWDPSTNGFDTIRKTKVWCDAERLELAEAIVSDDATGFSVGAPVGSLELELNDFYPYLSAGMQVVISGIPAPDSLPQDNRRPKRDDDHANIQSEVATIVQVVHDFEQQLYDDPIRTILTLKDPLANGYWRDTLQIAANVVLSTHGETFHETLGSGDARKRHQRFILKSAPLTRLPTADLDGQAEKLDLSVSNVKWHLTDRLLQQNEQSERFEVRSTRQGSTRVQFGDGKHGSRVPTGQDNVVAKYRVGLGTAGNVDIGQIDQLPAPPLGVRGVMNPTKGDGGADPDSPRQSRPRIPRASVRAARLISSRDYESFALLFAGVDKVSAVPDNGALRLVVAGMQPGPLRPDGLLLRSLTDAVEHHGDPNLPVTIVPHSGKLLYIQAAIQIDSRAQFDLVQAGVKKKLVERFGYPVAELGNDILASDVVATIQNVEHVEFVTLKNFDAITAEEAGREDPTGAVKLRSSITVEQHELCYVADSVDNTIVLEPAT